MEQTGWCLQLFLVCITCMCWHTKAQDCTGLGDWVQAAVGGSFRVPPNYGPDYLCTWRLSAPYGQIIKLTFSSIQLSTEPYCGADLISVFDDTMAPVRDLCGVWITPTILTSGGQSLVVQFTSDRGATSGQGFEAQWTAVNAGSELCQGLTDLVEPTGVLRSSLSSSNYANAASCCWRISVYNAQSIALTFQTMDLERQVSCSGDTVTVYEGSGNNSPLVGTRCNNDITSVVVQGPNMFVCFWTDTKGTRSGFKATYDATMKATTTTTTTTVATTTTTVTYPGQDIAEHVCKPSREYQYERYDYVPSGSISTDSGPYANNLDCLWDISSPGQQVVMLTLKTFDLASSAGCNGDFLQLIDLHYNTIHKLCGTLSSQRKVSSGQNWMRIWFRSDNIANQNRGFYAEWSAVKYNDVLCQEKTELTAPSGTIISSEGDYINAVTCRWKISVAYNMVIELTIHRIDLEEVTGCYKDKLRIYNSATSDSGQLLATLCKAGVTTAFSYKSTGRNMYILFTSDNGYVATGFRMTYKSIPSTIPLPTTTFKPETTTDYPDRCGSRGKLQRVLNGNVTKRWPWIVSLRDPRGNHIGGGALVASRWIVTAAHVVEYWRSPFGYKAVLGLHNVKDPGIQHKILRIIKHPYYKSYGTYYNHDIALLQLETAVVYSEEARPICLPSSSLPFGYACKIAGWGEIEANTQKKSDLLIEAQAPIEYDFYCDYYHPGKYDRSTMLCAGYYDGYASACHGDSGGPLGCNVSNIYYLQGIISYNSACGTFGVHTRVTAFTEWIKAVMLNPRDTVPAS